MVFSVVLYAQAQNKQKFNYAFMRNRKIIIYNTQTKKETSLKKGYDPAISPDGEKIAYTDYNKKLKRHVEVMNLHTKKTKRLNVNNKNYWGAQWSLDNTHLAFNIFNDSRWDVALITDTGRQKYKIISGEISSDLGVLLSSWTLDGKNIIVRTMDSLYVMDMDGNISNKTDLKLISGELVSSSDRRVLITADKKYYVYDGDSDDDGYDKDGPPSAIYRYDMEKNEIKRLTPKGYDCRQPVLTDEGKILYEGAKFNTETLNVYSTDINGSTPVEILNNASGISCSRK